MCSKSIQLYFNSVTTFIAPRTITSLGNQLIFPIKNTNGELSILVYKNFYGVMLLIAALI